MQLLKQRNASLSCFLILLISKYKIMKKTYISPEALVVKIGCKGLVAMSFEINDSGADEGVVLTKESNTVTNKSLWDEEW